MSDQNPFQHQRWAEIPEEAMKGTITRRLITGERMMIAQVVLKKGDFVPQHSHHNEQLTYIISGALHFHLPQQRLGDLDQHRQADRRAVVRHKGHRLRRDVDPGGRQ